MAGDWLKVEAITPDKPEVFEIAVQLKITPAEAFGRLFLVWRWFDQQTEDGNATNVTPAYLDHISGVAGFSDAMRNVGWLEGGDGQSFGIKLPHFDYHNGKTAKSRALTAKRQVTYKSRKGNDVVTHIASPREEKRREEVNTTAWFDSFWKAYPKKVAKPEALKAFRKLQLANGDFEKMMLALEVAKKSPQWTSEGGKFIPHAKRWLSGRRFEDEVAPKIEKTWTP